MIEINLKNTIKSLVFLPFGIFIFFILWYLNSGMYPDLVLTLLSAVFSFIVLFLLSGIIKRRLLLYFEVLLFVIMTVAFSFQESLIANISGSLFFGIILILLVSYLSQLIKFGEIKKW